MTETLGTKDVIKQITTRLNLVEQDIRALRAELHSRSVELTPHFAETKINTPTYQVHWEGLRQFRLARILLVVILLNLIGLWFK